MTIPNLPPATVVLVGWTPLDGIQVKAGTSRSAHSLSMIRQKCFDNEGDMDEALPGGDIGQLPTHSMTRAGARDSRFILSRGHGRAVSGSVVFIFGRQ